jgi:hypothetical protein
MRCRRRAAGSPAAPHLLPALLPSSKFAWKHGLWFTVTTTTLYTLSDHVYKAFGKVPSCFRLWSAAACRMTTLCFMTSVLLCCTMKYGGLFNRVV